MGNTDDLLWYSRVSSDAAWETSQLIAKLVLFSPKRIPGRFSCYFKRRWLHNNRPVQYKHTQHCLSDGLMMQKIDFPLRLGLPFGGLKAVDHWPGRGICAWFGVAARTEEKPMHLRRAYLVEHDPDAARDIARLESQPIRLDAGRRTRR